MKTTYEGMFILPKALSEEAVEEALGVLRGEITKLDGEVKSTTRLGKRVFAHTLKKQDMGYYVVIVFQMEGANLASLRTRLKLNEDVLRAQFVRAEEGAAAGGAKVPQEAKTE